MHFIREHYLIIILGFLLTLLIEAPALAFPFIAKEKYQGINIIPFGTDSHFYLSRMKEALEGRALGSPFLREGKDKQDIFFTYNERVLVSPIRLLGLADKANIATVYSVYNFIGVFILILLVYAFVFQLSRSKLLSATAAIFAIGGYHIAYKQFFYSDFNFYTRPSSPFLSSLAFFAYLNLLTLWLKTKKFVSKILSAAVLGLSFYVYLFTWTFALALNGILFLLYFLKRDWDRVKSIIFISFAGALIGFYNLLQMFVSLKSGAGPQISYFQGSVFTHSPTFSVMGAVMLLIFLVFLYKKRRDSNLILIFSLIMAGWISLNQQVITGRAVEPVHYYWYFIVPMSILAGLYMLWVWLEGRAWRKLLFIFILLVIFFHSALGQYRSIFANLAEREYEQSYQPIIEILNADSQPGVVLAADDQLAYLFTIYTNHDLFWKSSAMMAMAPLSRFADALYVYIYLNKDAQNDFSGYIYRVMKDQGDISFYKGVYKHIEGFRSGLDYYNYTGKAVNNKALIGQTRDKLVAELAEKYSKLANGAAINNLLRDYGVNYIVWDKNTHPEWDLSFISGLKEIIASNNIYLYKINY